MNGKIKTLKEKGFGFISSDSLDKDIFFHSNSLVGVTFEELREGDGKGAGMAVGAHLPGGSCRHLVRRRRTPAVRDARRAWAGRTDPPPSQVRRGRPALGQLLLPRPGRPSQPEGPEPDDLLSDRRRHRRAELDVSPPPWGLLTLVPRVDPR